MKKYLWRHTAPVRITRGKRTIGHAWIQLVQEKRRDAKIQCKLFTGETFTLRPSLFLLKNVLEKAGPLCNPKAGSKERYKLDRYVIE